MERNIKGVVYKQKSFINICRSTPTTKILILLTLIIFLVLFLILFDIQSLQKPLIISSSSSPLLTSWSLQQWNKKVFKSSTSVKHINYGVELEKLVSKLRESVTFLPLKDMRYEKSHAQGNTWFMSSLNNTYDDDDEVEYVYFPSEASKGRLLCVAGRDMRDGGKNMYGLAWKESLPPGATLMEGLTFVSDTYYDYGNPFHALAAMGPFVGWYKRKGCCEKPTRWVLYHWGELRTRMGSWIKNLMEATFGEEVKVEGFIEGGNDGPFCFEKALVMRHNFGRMGKGKRIEVFDMLRCKARAFCNVTSRPDYRSVIVEGNKELVPMFGLTLLMRNGARSFKNETVVIEIFQRECAMVEGCKLTVAHTKDLSFCDQVRLLSSTDILVSPHGAQLTNMFFMDKNSSVMEFYPKGWLELAGAGQYVYIWTANLSGMRHEGAWRDQHEQGDEECPHPQRDHQHCFLFYKDGQIGQNETFFAEWSRRVINQVRIRKLDQFSNSLNTEQQPNSTVCACG